MFDLQKKRVFWEYVLPIEMLPLLAPQKFSAAISMSEFHWSGVVHFSRQIVSLIHTLHNILVVSALMGILSPKADQVSRNQKTFEVHIMMSNDQKCVANANSDHSYDDE